MGRDDSQPRGGANSIKGRAERKSATKSSNTSGVTRHA